MLLDERPSVDNLEAPAFENVLQFYQRILIIAVSEKHNDNCQRPVPGDGFQIFQQHIGHAPRIDGNTDNDDGFPRKRDDFSSCSRRCKINGVDLPLLRQVLRKSICCGIRRRILKDRVLNAILGVSCQEAPISQESRNPAVISTSKSSKTAETAPRLITTNCNYDSEVDYEL